MCELGLVSRVTFFTLSREAKVQNRETVNNNKYKTV